MCDRPWSGRRRVITPGQSVKGPASLPTAFTPVQFTCRVYMSSPHAEHGGRTRGRATGMGRAMGGGGQWVHGRATGHMGPHTCAWAYARGRTQWLTSWGRTHDGGAVHLGGAAVHMRVCCVPLRVCCVSLHLCCVLVACVLCAYARVLCALLCMCARGSRHRHATSMRTGTSMTRTCS